MSYKERLEASQRANIKLAVAKVESEEMTKEAVALLVEMPVHVFHFAHLTPDYRQRIEALLYKYRTG